MEWGDLFDAQGNFKIGRYDPYRVDDEDTEIVSYHSKIFEYCGSVRYEVYSQILEWLTTKKNLCYFCDAVKLIHAQDHGSSTKGSYPAIYMWR